MFHTTTHTTQSWHLPPWSPINSHEGSVSIATSSYKQSSMVDKVLCLTYGKLIMWINFGYSFKETLKAEKHSNFRTSLYTAYWVVLPSYKAYIAYEWKLDKDLGTRKLSVGSSYTPTNWSVIFKSETWVVQFCCLDKCLERSFRNPSSQLTAQVRFKVLCW